LRHAFRTRAKRAHPDHGGDAAEFRSVVAAYRAGIAFFGSAPPADQVTVTGGRLVPLDNGWVVFACDGSPALIEAAGPTTSVTIAGGQFWEIRFRAVRGGRIVLAFP
jgi:hypothetical protein